MKRSKKYIIISLLAVFLVALIVCGIAVYHKQQQKVEKLNSCYEYITETIENGFDKEHASEKKELFKEVLENDITENVFKKSKFYNSDISFSALFSWNCPEFRSDLNVAHCRDLVLAMYLSCVLSTEPEKLVDEFELLKDGIWQMDPKPEFMHLIATKYNPTKEDIDVLVNSVIAFSETIEHPLDKYHTRAFVHTFIIDYNANHKDDKYVLENEDEFIKENIEIFKQINKDDLGTFWVGYGKVIPKYQNTDQSGDG